MNAGCNIVGCVTVFFTHSIDRRLSSSCSCHCACSLWKPSRLSSNSFCCCSRRFRICSALFWSWKKQKHDYCDVIMQVTSSSMDNLSSVKPQPRSPSTSASSPWPSSRTPAPSPPPSSSSSSRVRASPPPSEEADSWNTQTQHSVREDQAVGGQQGLRHRPYLPPWFLFFESPDWVTDESLMKRKFS